MLLDFITQRMIYNPTYTTAYPALVSETVRILGISGASQHVGSHWQVPLQRVNKPGAGAREYDDLRPEALALVRRWEHNVRWWWRDCLD